MVAFSQLYIHIRFSNDVVILVNVINRAGNLRLIENIILYNTFYFLKISIFLFFFRFFFLFLLFCVSNFYFYCMNIFVETQMNFFLHTINHTIIL